MNMTKPTNAQVADHHRHLVSTLTAMSTEDPISIAIGAKMLVEHDRQWLANHVGFLSRCLFNLYDAEIEDCGDSWPSFLAGMARAGVDEYGE